MVQVRMRTTANPWQFAILWLDGCNFRRPLISGARAGLMIGHLALLQVSSSSTIS